MFLTFCRPRGRTASVRFDRMAEIAWTSVHAIIKSGTCIKDNLSDAIKGLTLGHVASRESPDHHQMKTARSRSDDHGDARSSSLRGDT